eukprot:6173114-Pleurochrysis_carterae.AAC.1
MDEWRPKMAFVAEAIVLLSRAGEFICPRCLAGGRVPDIDPSVATSSALSQAVLPHSETDPSTHFALQNPAYFAVCPEMA